MLDTQRAPAIRGLKRQAIRLRRQVLALLLATLGAACRTPAVADADEPAAQPGIGVLRPEFLPAPPEDSTRAVTDQDRLVLDAVFEDILRATEDTLLHYRGQAPEVLRVAPAASERRITGDSVRQCLGADDRADLPAVDQADLDQAIEQLARRSDRSLGDYASEVPGVTRDPPSLSTSRRESVVRAYLPGYSDDGQLAVVRLTAIVGRHAAHLHTVLRRGDQGWQVILRQSGVHV